MPDEASTPPDSTSSPQAADAQAPPSEPVTTPAAEPPKSEDTSGQATPPEAAAPAPETPPTETSAQAEVSEAVPEPVPEPQTQSEPAQTNSSAPSPATAQAAAPTSIIGELLVKARAKIQDRRKKKLERITMQCERRLIKKVITAIKKAHPYEEVPIFVYPIEDY